MEHNKEKQIEEMTCKNCIHYEVCMYVNAQAVEYARSENCKLFKNTAGYRKASEFAREIFEEIEKLLLNNHIESFKNLNDDWVYRFKVNMVVEIAELKKKYIGKDTNVTTNTEGGE